MFQGGTHQGRLLSSRCQLQSHLRLERHIHPELPLGHYGLFRMVSSQFVDAQMWGGAGKMVQAEFSLERRAGRSVSSRCRVSHILRPLSVLLTYA